jgi:ParB family transcriptional regulator, chromosome partitioning protein
MSKLFSSSPLILGIIDDIDLSRIKRSPFLSRNMSDDTSIELAQSIKEKGLLQPILIRTKESYFEIVSGNRRYHACKSLGWRKIICHVLELDDKQAFEISLIENIQRKTLDPKEEAQAFKSYIMDHGWGGISHLSAKIGKSVSYVQRRVKLLDLPSDVLDSMSNSSISTAVAEELLSLDDKDKQSQLTQLVSKNRLSSRKVRELVKDLKGNSAYDYNNETYLSAIKMVDVDNKAHRSFDKSIIALKAALNKIGGIISEIEDNWIAHEILMQHKNVLHGQIDLLLKEKRKL